MGGSIEEGFQEENLEEACRGGEVKKESGCVWGGS